MFIYELIAVILYEKETLDLANITALSMEVLKQSFYFSVQNAKLWLISFSNANLILETKL